MKNKIILGFFIVLIIAGDAAKFKALVETGNPDIKVTQLDWYAKK